jgi:excisionase family DNA binding protein
MGPVMMVSIMSTDDPPPSPRFLKIEDAAAELATSKSQIYALLRSGELQGIQIGGRAQWRIERVKLEDYIEQAYRKTAESLAELPSDLPDAAAD